MSLPKAPCWHFLAIFGRAFVIISNFDLGILGPKFCSNVGKAFGRL